MKILKCLSILGPLSLVISSQVYICKHIYVYEYLIKENDCTNYGIASYKCKNCGHCKEEKILPDSNKHIWEEEELISSPTCVKKGVKRCCCKLNPEHQSVLEIDCVPHDLSNHFEHQFPTFRLNGLKEHYICPQCNNYLAYDGKTIVSYSDLIIKKYDSTRIDFVEYEILDLSKKYNDLVEEDIVYIKNIYLDMNALNEIEMYYLKKERNEILNMDYYNSFRMIVNKYNNLFVN